MMTIAEVARVTGLTPRMIRHYGSIGLVPEPERSAGRYRLYSDDDVGRLRLIAAARDCGLSIDEIRDVVALVAGTGGDGAGPHELAQGLLRSLEVRARGLRLVRLALEKVGRPTSHRALEID